MQLPHGVVIALVDGKRFDMFRNSGNEAGPVLAPLSSPDLDKHDKGGGADRDSSSANPTGHQIDEDAHAAAAAAWLNHAVTDHKIEQIVVVASPRTLGEMRRHYHKQLQAALIAEVPKNLIGKNGPELLAALRGK